MIGTLKRIALRKSGVFGLCRSFGSSINLTGPSKKAVGDRAGLVVRSAGLVLAGTDACLVTVCADVLQGYLDVLERFSDWQLSDEAMERASAQVNSHY